MLRKSCATRKAEKFSDRYIYPRDSIVAAGIAPEKLKKLSLDNSVLQFQPTPSGRYSCTISLQLPIELSPAEAQRLSRATDNWPGWGDSPGVTLAELGQLIESAIAGAGGAR